MIWWYVALGSAAGGAARFGLSTLVQQQFGPTFPVGTLVVNVSGSLLLGFLWRYALGTDATSPEVRALLTTGFCGGYTTFSTFTYETMVLFEDGQSVRAGVYVISSVLLSLAAVWLGASGARTVLGIRAHG